MINRHITLLGLLVSLLGPGFADTGPDPAFLGTPYPYGELTEEWGYFSFSPGDYPTVTLVSEKVEVVLYHNHASVYGRYIFENTGPALTMGMAMPLVARWRSMSVPYVLVGVGEPGEVPSDRCQIDHWKTYDPETDPANPPLSGHWATWFLDIPAGERREVWVTYDTPFSLGEQVYDLWEVEEDEIHRPHRYLNYQVYSSAFWPEIVERTSLRFILGHGVTWEDLASAEGAALVSPVDPEDFHGTQISLGPDFFEIIFDRFDPRTEPESGYYGEDFFPVSDSWNLQNIWLWIGEYPHPRVNLQYSASSELVPEGGHGYKALNVDFLYGYASNYPWCEGVDGDGVGEWLKVEMTGEARVTGVTIFNGYHSDGDLYWKNGRAKRITCTADVKGEIYRSTITFDESTEYVRDFRHPSSAYLVFERPLELEALNLTLEEVYPGDVWSDTCIGSVEFDYLDPRTHHRASSSLVEELGDLFRFHAIKANDGDPATCWSEGAEGDGVGEWIEYWWETEKEFTKITITPGFAKSEELYRANARPAKLELTYSTGESEVIELEDQMKAQTFEIDTVGPVTSVRMEIKSVYPGEEWDDCCIAEINFQ